LFYLEEIFFWSENIVLFDESSHHLDFGCDDVLNSLDDGDLLLSLDRILFILHLVFFALASPLIVSVFGSIEFLARMSKQ
jgi:hypothetical protein